MGSFILVPAEVSVTFDCRVTSQTHGSIVLLHYDVFSCIGIHFERYMYMCVWTDKDLKAVLIILSLCSLLLLRGYLIVFSFYFISTI